jgi:hypothetical protein
MNQPDPNQAQGEYQPEHNTGYRSIVNPERVVVIPGYALRLLRHGDLSPKEMSLWVAFHQAVYSTWRDGGSKAKHIAENIPHQQVIGFAMMSRASFFREVTGQQSVCGGLVEAEEPQPDPYASRQVANALRYKVSMEPRLTRRDIGIIQAILEKAVAGHEGEGTARQAEQALTDLLSQNPGAYLDDRRAQVVQVEGWPRTLAEVVRRVIGAKTLPDLLRKMADNLQERILAGYGNVVITHYFLHVAAPALGLSHAQAWTVIALRDRVWFDYATGERWPFAIAHGGLDELAAMTGSTVKSVRNWLDEPGFGAFVSIQKTPARVELPEYWDARTLVFYVDLLEPVLNAEKVSNGQGKSEQQSETSDREKMSTGEGKNEHRTGKKRAPVWEKVSIDSGKNEHLLNNFYKRYISFNNRRHQRSEGKNEARFSEGSAAGWDFSSRTPDPESWDDQPKTLKPAFDPNYWTLRELVEVNTINHKKLAAMGQAGTSPEVLAEWLSEAYAKTGLTNPVGYAVQNALDYPYSKNPKSLFARRRKPEILQKLAFAIAGYPMSDDAEFASFVRRYSKSNLLNLFIALGGDAQDIPAQYVPPAPEPRPIAVAEQAQPVQIPEHIRKRGEELLARLRQK